ncbi:MAG: hypothetical protein R3E32_20015 [Chitinophagales bacterium]
MNYFKNFLFCLSIFLFSNLFIQAQTTPEGMLIALNKQMEECKANIEYFQNIINKAEGLTGDEITAAVENWRKILDENKKCVELAQKQLDYLKLLYPTLFTSPNSQLSENKVDRNNNQKVGLGAKVEGLMVDLLGILILVNQQFNAIIEKYSK